MNLKKIFYNKKKKDKKTTIRLCGIPVYKCSFVDNYRRKYLFGILFSKKTLFQKTEDIKDRVQKDEIVNALNVFSCRIEKETSDLKIQNNALEKELMNFKAVEMCSENEEKNAIFLAGSGAIANYTVKIHSCQPESFDIFADVLNFAQWNHLRSLHKNASKIIFPISSFKTISKIRKYKNKIFVLGNSQHHRNIFELVCKTKDDENRCLILHEAFVLGAFFHRFDFDVEKVRASMIFWYPHLEKELKEAPTNLDALEAVLLEHNCCFIRPVIEMTGIKKMIVYSEKTENLIRKELTEKEQKNLKILSVPLPFERIENTPKESSIIKQKPKYLIGTFGYPHDVCKRSIDIIKAVEALHKEMDVQLVMAGPGVANYQSRIKDEKSIILADTPSDEEWLALMNTIDLGIQLREKAHGFSSACVSELLALGKPCLVTEGMLDKKWGCLFDFLPEGVSVYEISEAIKKILSTTKKADQRLYADYSFSRNAQMISDFIRGGK